MNTQYPNLLKPGKIGRLELKNRVVVTPVGLFYAESNGEAGDRFCAYMEERARGGAGLIMTTLVFTEVGIPLEAVALIAGIDRILDMIRTSVNVLGDSLTALVVSKSEGVLGTELMDQDTVVKEQL